LIILIASAYKEGLSMTSLAKGHPTRLLNGWAVNAREGSDIDGQGETTL